MSAVLYEGFPVASDISSFSDTQSTFAGQVPSARRLSKFRAWRPTPRFSAEEIKRREHVIVTEYSGEDLSVLPGQPATSDVFEFIDAKARLVRLIHQFASDGFDTEETEERIGSGTVDASSKLIDLLPLSSHLPKLSPDGDGGLMAVWESGDSAVIVVVDDWKLHVVTGAATPQAQYFDALAFDGISLPTPLLDAILVR
jgi:hypothetical protein